MGTKEQLLACLEARQGEFLSGEELAQQLNISRAAVWKAVNALREAGFGIQAVRNRGYCLDGQADILSPAGLLDALDEYGRQCRPEVISCVPSTNALVRERAAAGAPEGLVILANQQTEGRGRLGRTFYSPPDTGIYLSLLLRPRSLLPAQAVKITTMAAVAACEAIEAVTGRAAGIKWVNDIFIDGKKVCGILTEGSYNLETGRLEDVVVGIGFNVYPPADRFPEALEGIAGSLLESPQSGTKNSLAAAFLNRFFRIYQGADSADYAAAYRARSLVTGHFVRVITPSGTRRARAQSVDEACRLVVQYEDGSTEALSSTEVSILPEEERITPAFSPER